MNCPKCQNLDTTVLETRSLMDGAVVKRRRKCVECEVKFTTLEKLDSSELMVKKRNSNREPFDGNKVFEGIRLACEKRPLGEDQIRTIVDQVESKVLDRGSRVIESREIGEMVMGILKQVDEVAYLRFASVCRSFDNASQFVKELQNLKND